MSKIKVVLKDGRSALIDERKFGIPDENDFIPSMQSAQAYYESVYLKKIYYYQFLIRDFSGSKNAYELVCEDVFEKKLTQEELLSYAISKDLGFYDLVLIDEGFQIDEKE